MVQCINQSLVVLLIFCSLACGQIPKHSPESVRSRSKSTEPRSMRTASLRAESARPRLMVSSADIDTTKKLIQSDPIAKQWFDTIRGRADQLVEKKFSLRESDRLLVISRETLLHISYLAGTYQLTSEKRYAARAIEELLEVCKLKDWNPDEEFLATSEMTTAVAIGYDWLYSVMSSEQRTQILDALIDKGLQAGLNAYGGKMGWTKVNHNQNLVSNGAMIVAALAVMDDEPELSKRVLEKARSSIRNGLETFAPDGAWPEGPSYWTYATRYLAYAYSSLEIATGSDWGITQVPGVGKTGLFRIYDTSPRDETFNFGDSSPAVSNSAQLMWLARKFDHPEYASWEQQWIGRDVGMFDLLWYRPVDSSLHNKLPLDAKFRGVEMGSFRGSWTDTDTTFIGFKGGNTEFRHSHLDLGTFVLDALGERWAIDLGSDNYDLPDYFGNRRWNYYRCSTRGHNTITLDNQNQEREVEATITSIYSSVKRSNAIIDLKAAYSDDARQARRGIALLDRKQVLIQDELELKDNVDVSWGMHTNAEIRINGSTATLRQNGKTVTMQILSPAGASFDQLGVRLASPQEPVNNVRKLFVRLASVKKNVTIAILFTPGASESSPPKVTPLSDWPPTK